MYLLNVQETYIRTSTTVNSTCTLQIKVYPTQINNLQVHQSIQQGYSAYNCNLILHCSNNANLCYLQHTYSPSLPFRKDPFCLKNHLQPFAVLWRTSTASRPSLSQKRGFQPYIASVEGFQDIMLLQKTLDMVHIHKMSPRCQHNEEDLAATEIQPQRPTLP